MLRKSKILSLSLCFCLLFEQTGFAQVAGALDISGHIAAFRNSFTQDKFRPLHLRSLGYDNNQNNFRLLLDKGDLKNPKKPDLEVTTKTLLNYFFVGVTLPNDTFWVNLRPDSENNIIDSDLATTDVGKILLEADLQLKKDTAKFTSPETPKGKEYWDKLYQKAGELLGYENITIPTLTRPWIVPGEIIIRETKDNAYIYKATLKVMLEQDYLKDSATYNFDDPRLKTLNEYSSYLIRDLIIPKLTKEVNTSQRYAPLRQVYYSLILAQWFKARFYGKGGLYSWLIDKKDLTGLTSKESWSKDTYFKQYQESFKEGEYNLKVPVSTPFGQSIRSYFSGGIGFGNLCKPDSVIPGNPNHSPLSKGTLPLALAEGGDLNDLSARNVKIEEASSPSGLPAGGLQSGASSENNQPTQFGSPAIELSSSPVKDVKRELLVDLGEFLSALAKEQRSFLSVLTERARRQGLPQGLFEIYQLAYELQDIESNTAEILAALETDIAKIASLSAPYVFSFANYKQQQETQEESLNVQIKKIERVQFTNLIFQNSQEKVDYEKARAEWVLLEEPAHIYFYPRQMQKCCLNHDIRWAFVIKNQKTNQSLVLGQDDVVSFGFADKAKVKQLKAAKSQELEAYLKKTALLYKYQSFFSAILSSEELLRFEELLLYYLDHTIGQQDENADDLSLIDQFFQRLNGLFAQHGYTVADEQMIGNVLLTWRHLKEIKQTDLEKIYFTAEDITFLAQIKAKWQKEAVSEFLSLQELKRIRELLITLKRYENTLRSLGLSWVSRKPISAKDYERFIQAVPSWHSALWFIESYGVLIRDTSIQHLLDLGAGPSVLFELLRREGLPNHMVTEVDNSSEMHALALNPNKILADMSDLTNVLPQDHNETFDLITSFYAFSLLSAEEIKKTLLEAHRLLKLSPEDRRG